MHCSDRVRLRDNTDVPITRHGRSTQNRGIIEVHTLAVVETRTTSVEVLCQDGTKEGLDVREIVPYLNPGEYDC